jgi:hypothetical protein
MIYSLEAPLPRLLPPMSIPTTITIAACVWVPVWVWLVPMLEYVHPVLLQLLPVLLPKEVQGDQTRMMMMMVMVVVNGISIGLPK